MIKTGVKNLDDILGGGIRNGTITDIFGSSGTGKTQLALQIIVNSLLNTNSILYQDTTGNFRPERLLEMAKPKGLDPSFLDRITVARITNTSEQLNSISKIDELNFSLIVIDNVTDLFSFEYVKEDQLLEKTTQFTKYMIQLSKTISHKKIPTIITNMMRKTDDGDQENLDSIISLFTHIKIRLTKMEVGYQGQVFFNPLKKNQFSYKITKEGLMDL